MIPALEFVPLLLKPAEKGDRKENKQKKGQKKLRITFEDWETFQIPILVLHCWWTWSPTFIWLGPEYLGHKFVS